MNNLKTLSSLRSLSGLTNYLRTKTYTLNQSLKIEPFFNSGTEKRDDRSREIIQPLNNELIQLELNNLDEEYFLFSQGGFSVYCVPYFCIPTLILEIGRLREITFREVGEGTNKNIDLDQFDIHYNHLIVWDNSKKQLAGSYRIGKGKDIFNQYGISGFYINSLFKIKSGFYPFMEVSVELGRSFIVKEYQRQRLSLFLLWKGIIWFLMKNPEYKYLIGAVSISNDFSEEAKSLIVQFIKKFYFDISLSEYIEPTKKFKIHKKVLRNNEIILKGLDKNLKILDLYINQFQPSVTVPILLKRYLQMNGKIIGFNIDIDFNNCLDCLMIAKIADLSSMMLDNTAKDIEESKVKKRLNSIAYTRS